MPQPAECVLAVDMGTTTTRAALVDAGGRIIDAVSRQIPLLSPCPGWAEQDPDHHWWASARANIRDVLLRNPGCHPLAVGVGAQMHGVVPLGPNGEVLTPRVGIWSDKRAHSLVATFRARHDAPRLEHTAGNLALPAWPGFKIAWWRQEEPDIYSRAKAFLVVKDFINYRLTGGVCATDPSEASGTFLMDAASGSWSAELAGALGVDPGKLPPIGDSTSVIGGVDPQVSRETGLPSGLPVVCGAGDMMCQLLAAGVTRPGRVCEVSGTASIIAAHAETPAQDLQAMNLRAAAGGWLRFGITDAGGKSFSWFADELCEAQSEAATREGRSRYDELTGLAAEVPAGANGLFFFPYLLGERTLGNAQSRASFVGLTPSHGRPEMVRALLEGVCLELRRALEVMAPPRIQAVRVTGGGARSTTWNQIRADVYAAPVQELRSFEGGILGAALLAGTAAGMFADPAAAAESLNLVSRTFQPHPAPVRAYGAHYRRFCSLHGLLAAHWAADGGRAASAREP